MLHFTTFIMFLYVCEITTKAINVLRVIVRIAENGMTWPGGSVIFSHCCLKVTTEAWWRSGNTFASYRYSLSSSPHGCCMVLTLTHMWDVFHPSQPMPGGFPLRVFFHPQKGLKLFHLEPSHKACPAGHKKHIFNSMHILNCFHKSLDKN